MSRSKPMGSPVKPNTVEDLAAHLRKLHEERWARQAASRPARRRLALSTADRHLVHGKTGGKCHICGGAVGDGWQADHVLAHSAGGQHDPENYLPAHALCNNYRWDYLPEEFQLILKLGVWLRTQIERETSTGKHAAEGFMRHENNRRKRQLKSHGKPSPRPT